MLRKSFRLTPALISAHAGSPVTCLSEIAIGQTYRLYDERPGAELNSRLYIRNSGVVVEPDGTVEGEGDEDTDAVQGLTVVRIDGPIEQRAGYHDECGGWSDGHDAIAERMIAALEEGDVLLCIDSPGGAHAGLEQAVARVVREKMEHGRRVTVYADECIGSAAYWWAACVADEIYAPPSAIVGSIGARAAHGSEAGALAQAGVEITYFAWPGAGKIAFAPELPLSDLGRQRGERDVSIAGESFALAVGPRRGMSREEIVELDADALCGDMAVSAKLVDGLASYEDVLDYCIAHAERDGEMMATANQTNPQATATRAANLGLTVRSEDPDNDGDADDKPEKKEGLQPDGVCKSCGHQMRNEAKYCDQCGDSMEAAPLESEEKDPEKEDAEDEPKPGERAEEDKPKPGERAEEDEPKPGEKKAAPPPPMKETRGASYASLLGLRKGASDLAIKTAIVKKLQVVEYVAQVTGATREDQMLGQLRAMSEDASESGALRRDVAKMRGESNRKERLALLTKLSNLGLPDYPRGNLLIDEVAANGRVLSIKPAPAYAEMKLATLRGLVQGKIANAGPVEASPYVSQPDPAKSQASVQTFHVENAKSNPIVQNVAKSGVPLDVAAGIYAREFPGGK